MTKKLSIALTAIAMLTLLAFPAMATESAREITVRGSLQRTVEAGGWLIVDQGNKYLLLNSQRFQSESWFKEGMQVEAIGEPKPDVVTTQMEGTPFEVRSMRPINQSANQTVTGGSSKRITKVTVMGDSVVQAQPDTAIITVAVVTQNKRALDAQQGNATRSDAVVKALKAAAGAGAEVKTSGYSLQPQRIYRENQPPTISGYEARNTVTVTLSDLTKVGSVIDASTQAGANDITGIAFTLRRDRAALDEALAQATQEAIAKAKVVASALGGRLVRIAEVQEEGFPRPIPVYQARAEIAGLASAQTPIEVGTLEVTSRVQLIAEVEGDN